MEQRGFTLVEAAILAAILLVLAAIMIPAYTGYLPRSIVTDAMNESIDLRVRLEEFHQARRSLPQGTEAASFRADSAKLRTAKQIEWRPELRMLVVTMGNRYSDHEGKAFGWLAEAKGTVLDWKCGTIDLEPKYLPAACREEL